jgi:hypothetical protein
MARFVPTDCGTTHSSTVATSLVGENRRHLVDEATQPQQVGNVDHPTSTCDRIALHPC